jgi:hypothetical protein
MIKPDTHLSITNAIAQVHASYPDIPMASILICFHACIDAVQPTIAEYSMEVADLRDRCERFDAELDAMGSRLASLFRSAIDQYHVN